MTRRMITLSAQACQSASGNAKSLPDDSEQICKRWRLTNPVNQCRRRQRRNRHARRGLQEPYKDGAVPLRQRGGHQRLESQEQTRVDAASYRRGSPTRQFPTLAGNDRRSSPRDAGRRSRASQLTDSQHSKTLVFLPVTCESKSSYGSNHSTQDSRWHVSRRPTLFLQTPWLREGGK